MSNSLEERLKTSSSAFDGLLSLIPAKYYFDEATQEQWKQKKKEKDEIKTMKKKKFDPEAEGVSAKDVLKSREKTAKPVVIPGKKVTAAAPVEEKEISSDTSLSEDEQLDIIFDDEGNDLTENLQPKEEVRIESPPESVSEQSLTPETAAVTKSKRRRELSPEEQREKEENIAKLKEKLAQKISMMKEKRKAPGSGASGAATSREQILEERRRKEELRKSLKRKKEEEDEDEDESSDSEDEEESKAGGVMFGNIEFKDGGRVTSDLSNVRKLKKTGPANKDIKAHLKLVQAKKAKLSTLDKSEQEKIQEKSSWQKALANVEGVKVKDDEKLLKKALKRKEAQKRKSEREWRERKETVENTIRAKQERREENLRLRRENKGKPKKKQQKMKKTFKGVIRPKRAGFEGKVKRR